MRGWLVYNREGAKRNEWFIARLQEEARERGVALELKIADGIEDLPTRDLPDFAIVRAMNADVNERLKNSGVRTYNNAKTARVAGDKWQTYELCRRLKIPVLDTYKAEDFTCERTYPLVVKSRFGHGGSEVFWAENSKQAALRIDKKDTYILQEPAKILGKDMRVYVIKDTIIAAVLRSSKQDFRSNFSLGGSVELAKVSEQQKQIVKQLYGELKFDFVGIDFLPCENGYVLNEIEDAAGTRMLYSCSDIDVVPLFIKHVLNK